MKRLTTLLAVVLMAATCLTAQNVAPRGLFKLQRLGYENGRPDFVPEMSPSTMSRFRVGSDKPSTMQEMEEIKVYHSVWKRLPVILIGLAFSVWAVYALWQGRGQSWKTWLCLVLFGLGSLLYLCLTLKERWSGKPYLTVTATSLIVNNGYVFGRGWYMSEIALADVEYFELVPRSILQRRGPRLRIHYKGRMEEKYPTDLIGQISVGDIDMKPQLLCDLLNEQLRS